MVTEKLPGVRARILSALGAAVVAMTLSSCAEPVPGAAETRVSTSTSVTTADPDPTVPDPVPQLTDVTYTWSSGSVPPPWNHSWEFELLGTTGTLHFQARYSGDDFVKDRTFELTEQAAAEYRAAVAAMVEGYEVVPDESRSVGGATARLSWTDTSGGEKTIADIGALESTGQISGPLQDAAVSAVPADIFAEVSGAYEAWADEHDGS